MKVVKFFKYRQAIGSASTVIEGEAGLAITVAFCLAASQLVDNHIAWVVDVYGQQVAYVWSDGKLRIDCPRLLAGDCNREAPTMWLLWEKPV